MKIQVDEIMIDGSKITVIFTAEFGWGKAFWEGDIPVKNQKYDVEVDIHDILEWGKGILRNGEEICFINFKDSTVYIAGILEAVYDDGYSVLRIGNYIIPFIATGNPFPILTPILLSTKTIGLSPFYY